MLLSLNIVETYVPVNSKTKPSRGDRGKCVQVTFNVALMHRLIVYGKGVTNPLITKPHTMR